MDKLDIIYDLLKNVDLKQDSQTEHLIRVEVDISKNTKDLTEHIKRTNLLEDELKRHKIAVNERFKPFEEPRIAAKSVTKLLLWVGGIAGAVYSIYRVFLLF